MLRKRSRILSRWKLSPDPWVKLRDLAVLRLTRRFPMPGELQGLAAELREEQGLRAKTDCLARMREEWRREADTAPEVRQGGES